MGDVKSQFGVSLQTQPSEDARGNYILASLNFVAKDPRKPTAESAALLETMRSYHKNAGTNAESFAQYEQKILSHAPAETKPAAGLRSKPGTGLMG